jgi:hypothetical protein
MKKLLFIFSITALIIWSACSEKPEGTASVEIIDGVEYVHNKEVPLHPKKTVSFEEDLSIGGEDDEGNIVLFRPTSFIVDRNENIYIIDWQDQAIKAFNQNGEYIRTIGRKGEGPGEFRSIRYLTFLPNGRLLAMDYGARRTSIFNSSGNFLESYKWQKRFGQIHLATNSSCTLSESTYEGNTPLEGRKLFVKEYDFKGQEILTFGEFVVAERKVHSEKGLSIALSVPHSPKSVFTADPVRHYLYHLLNNKYLVEVFDRTGKVIRKIDRPYEPVPFSSQEAQEYKAGLEKSRNESTRKLAKEMVMPSIKTVSSRMLVDDLGNLWIETHEQKEEEERTLIAHDIFNTNGYYEARVWVSNADGRRNRVSVFKTIPRYVD